MNSFMEWFRQPVVEALGWTLLHFLWQGAAIAVLLLLAQAALRKSPSNARYLAGCLALFFMAVSPVLTFGYLTKRREQSVIKPALTSVVSRETVVTFPTVASSPLEFEAVPVRIHAPSFVVRVENSLPWLVAIWLSVVSVLSLRLLAGWLYVSKIGNSATESIGDPWEEKLANLIRQLNVSRPIRLLKSALVEVPTVIGWFRPVILLPASSLTSLTPAQLEAIIAHELFHIRRHDYLVNLLQSAVETLLFYHPAVWWVSRQICQERENCCDDLTVKICGDRIAYAKALATLEELRSRPLQLTVAAGSGSLLQRIRRLLGSPATPDRSGWLAVGAIAFLVLVAFLATSRRPLFAAEANKVVAEAGESEKNAPLLQFRLVAQQNDPSPAEGIPDPNSRVGNARKLRVLKEIFLDESDIESATLQDSLIDVRMEIAVTLTDAGAEKFARLTEQNVKRQLAIIFGGKILSAPRIAEKILSKHIALAGNFTRAEAEAIVAALNRARSAADAKANVPSSNAAAPRDSAYESSSVILPQSIRGLDHDLVKTFVERPEYRENQSLLIELTSEGLRIDLVDRPSQRLFGEGSASAEFTDYGKWLINTVAWELVRYSTTQIALEGHVEKGFQSNRQNYGTREVSRDRANAARTRLLANGVKESQITTVTGYGEEKPLRGRTAEDMSNGRVTLVLSASNKANESAKVAVSTLVQDARLLIELGKLDEAEAKLKLVKQDTEHTVARYYLNYIKEARHAQDSRGRKTDPGDSPIFPEERRLPLSKPVAQTNLVHTSPSRDRILQKLDRIILGEVLYDGIPLSDVIKDLNEKVRALDPDKRGINFIINSQIAAPATAGNVHLVTGQPIPVPAPEDPVDLSKVGIRINPALRNVRLADVLDAITKSADKLLKYSVEDYAVVFTQRTAEAPQLFTRTFKVDPNRFFENLQNELGPPFHSPGDTLRHFLTHIGIDFPANQVRLTGAMFSGFISGVSTPEMSKAGTATGKAVFMSERTGRIFARATLEELGIMEKAIQALNSAPPQVMLDFKFAEFTVSDSKAMGFHWLLGNVAVTNAASPPTNSLSVPSVPTPPERTTSNDGKQKTNSSIATINGVLTGPQFLELVHSLGRYGSNVLTIAKPSGNLYSNGALATLTGVLNYWQFRGLLQALEQRSGVDVLSLPRVTTLSGRPAKVETTNLKSIVVDVSRGSKVDSGNRGVKPAASDVYSTVQVPLGPSVDVTPNVSEDGHSIQMTITANLVEFLGYDDPGPFRAADGSLTAVSPLPRFRIRQVISDATVRDGQTLVLSGFAPVNSRSSTNNVPVLGNIPMPGRFLSSDASNKHLILFVTPTLIDPAGNSVHTDGNRPFDPNLVPPQPARK